MLSKGTNKLDFDTYRPPGTSFHCENLINSRNENLKVKQKLINLLERNSQLIRYTPKEREAAYQNLAFLRGEIKFKLEQRIFRIKAVEEKIVRSGCPSMISNSF